MIAEAAWNAEDEVPRRVGDDEARRLYEAALGTALADGAEALPADGARRAHALMGLVMPPLRGRVPGRLVREWVGAAIKEAR